MSTPWRSVRNTIHIIGILGLVGCSSASPTIRKGMHRGEAFYVRESRAPVEIAQSNVYFTVRFGAWSRGGENRFSFADLENRNPHPMCARLEFDSLGYKVATRMSFDDHGNGHDILLKPGELLSQALEIVFYESHTGSRDWPRPFQAMAWPPAADGTCSWHRFAASLKQPSPPAPDDDDDDAEEEEEEEDDDDLPDEPTRPPVRPEQEVHRFHYGANGQLRLPKPIAFELSSLVLTPESAASLDYVASYLRQHPHVTLLRIEGHFDDAATTRPVLEVTQDRAVVVARALVARGIDCKRLLAVGFGASKPVVPNDTPAHRARNRRIELVNAALGGKPIGGMPVDGGGSPGRQACRTP